MEQNKNDEDIDFSRAFDKKRENLEQKDSPAYQNNSSQENSKAVKFVIKHSGGLIKNKMQANCLLAVTAIIIIIISIVLIFTNLNGQKIPKEALENPEYGLPIKD